VSVCACPVCGGGAFRQVDVLWPELIPAWQLAPHEAAFVNRQQGWICEGCGANLRSMALAHAIPVAFGADGPFAAACARAPLAGLRVLEVNAAGTLTPQLARLPGHRLVAYPEVDLAALPMPDGSFDLVVHSDTLEHVSRAETALAECRRVLSPGGRCVFTVPVIPARLSRSRAGLPPSRHGGPGDTREDYTVQHEFGADVWARVLRAGFGTCAFHAIEFPAGLAIEARP